jgi:hypothetical protein
MARFGADPAVLLFKLPYVQWLGKPQWLLWPAWAWRVVAPRPRPRRMNVFQRAVLGLCLAGTNRAEDLGAKLMIAADLAALVVTELRGIGWLDGRDLPTPKGRQALEDDDTEAVDEQTVGWVFTDPFSGETWPRFHVGELPYADADSPTPNRWTVETGTRGNPHAAPAFEVRARSNELVREHRPRPEDILRAARAHRRQYGRNDEFSGADAPSMQRVSFVEERPAACLLAARAWLAGPGDWRVDDPFGLGDSLRLRRWVEDRFPQDRGLRDWLAPIAGGDPDAVDLKSLAQRAAWEVEERLTLAVRSQPRLHERLVVMQRALLEAEQEGSPDDKWEDVAVKAQQAAERLFLTLCEAHPPTTQLTRDPACNAALLDALARDLGFEAPLPPTLGRVKSGKVESAAREGSGSLRPLVLLALLGTSGVQEHPLAVAARAEPGLLHRLDALAAVRDRAAHEGSSEGRRAPSHRPRRVRDGVETVFQAVKLLLP